MTANGELLAAFGIEPADVELNRQGKISPRQADQIRSFVRHRRSLVVIAVVAAGALCLAGGIAAKTPIPPMVGGAVGGLIFVAVLFILLNKLLFGPLAEQADGGVRAVEGTIERRFVSARGYAIWINGSRYRGIKAKAGRLLKEGERVRLFVTNGGLIVGGEPA